MSAGLCDLERALGTMRECRCEWNRPFLGHFKSRALIGEAGLLTAMTYVDPDPVRAGGAPRHEESEFTPIGARIRALLLHTLSYDSRFVRL